MIKTVQEIFFVLLFMVCSVHSCYAGDDEIPDGEKFFVERIYGKSFGRSTAATRTARI